MKYADAGVDIEKADRAMGSIKSMVKETFNSNVMADFGNFGGLFSLANFKMEEPILVASVDGVGTKLKIGIDMGLYHCPGQDIVNHCIDDILVQGAFPLFFLDYYATGVLEEDALKGVIQGISTACKENNCALLGGETAEMPGFYKKGDFDLAGTIVGLVDKSKLIDGTRIAEGDVLIGLESTGLHTNGYSLARKVLLKEEGSSGKYALDDIPPGFTNSLGEALVKPHRSYLKPLLPLIDKKLINGMVHITGGGYPGNIPRVLPDNIGVSMQKNWDVPEVFKLIQSEGQVEEEEMYKTFNMGIGMILIVSPSDVDEVKEALKSSGENYHLIGKTVPHVEGQTERVAFN